MSGYLLSLAPRRQNTTTTQLLWEVGDAFDEAPPDSPARTLPHAQALHALLRFVKFDSLAPLLRDEPQLVRAALAFAHQIEDAQLARLLTDALAGHAQPPPRISVGLPGQAMQALNVEACAGTQFAGQDWGGTDLALSLAMDHFEEALLAQLIAEADRFDLAPPLALRQRDEADARVAAAAQGQTAASLLRALVSAPAPRMQAGALDEAGRPAPGPGQLLALTHLAHPAAPPDTLAALQTRYGAAAEGLLAMYAEHDGAQLFQYQGECGFYLVPTSEWAGELQHAIDWAEQVTWQDEKEEIPAYLYSAIPFGLTPGDSERWLLVTEGEHAGCVMLSDTDVMEDSPRFRSIEHFMSTLLTDSVRILASGGYVSYQVGDEVLAPWRYVPQ